VILCKHVMFTKSAQRVAARGSGASGVGGGGGGRETFNGLVSKKSTNRWFRELYKKGATPVAQKCIALLASLIRPFYIHTLIQQLRFGFPRNASANAWSQQAHACMLSQTDNILHLYEGD
jgi:hypothetical protein